MFGLENRGKTLVFMLRHFDETMTILISYFLRFGALKWLTGDYFVLRINQLILQTKNWMFYSFWYFSQHFFYSSFSHSLCTGWRTSGVWIELHISK